MVTPLSFADPHPMRENGSNSNRVSFREGQGDLSLARQWFVFEPCFVLRGPGPGPGRPLARATMVRIRTVFRSARAGRPLTRAKTVRIRTVFRSAKARARATSHSRENGSYSNRVSFCEGQGQGQGDLSLARQWFVFEPCFVPRGQGDLSLARKRFVFDPCFVPRGPGPGRPLTRAKTVRIRTVFRSARARARARARATSHSRDNGSYSNRVSFRERDSHTRDNGSNSNRVSFREGVGFVIQPSSPP